MESFGAKGEYFNIDMSMAINFVITKSKVFREKLENEQVSPAFLQE